MSEEEVLMGVRIPSELKRLVDADSRTNKDVVVSALWREFGGKREGALQREIEEKSERIATVNNELEARRQERLEYITEIRELLRAKKEAYAADPEVIEDAIETLSTEQIEQLEPDHAPAQHWSKKAGTDAETFVAELKEAYENA